VKPSQHQDAADYLRDCAGRLIAGSIGDADIEAGKLYDSANLIEQQAKWLNGWHRIAQTIATVLDLPEPEMDFAGKVRDKFDALNEQIHDANGVADLAIKHRDAAEARLAEAMKVIEPFASGSIDIAGAAIIIGYPAARPALDAARSFLNSASNKEPR